MCQALTRHPVTNAKSDVEASTATYRQDGHLGIVVHTEPGLPVPILRAAQDLTVMAIARRMHDLTERCHRGELVPGERSGGAFTLSNPGSRGVLLDTPILDPPQVAILSTALSEKRPVVVTDRLGFDALAIRDTSCR